MATQDYFNNIEKYNSMEVLEAPSIEESFKRAFETVGESVETVVDYMVDKGHISEADIPKVTNVLKEVKLGAVTSVLEWDSSKSTDDNIAHITGQITQDLGEGLAAAGIIVGGYALFSASAPAVVLTAGGFILGEILGEVADAYGIDLGVLTEKAYNYSQDFQATNLIETARLEELKISNPEAYGNMVASGIVPENTVAWNTHINELTQDLFSRKAENYKNTINYENSAVIDEDTTLSKLATENGLTEKQILEYNNLNIKPEDYGNIKDGTTIAIPSVPDVNDGVTVYTDSEGNQKIISVDATTGEKTVFYYNAKDYSLLEIDGNLQIHNKVNLDGSVITEKLGLGSIEVTDSNNSQNSTTIKTISDKNYELVIDSDSPIHSNTQLDVLLRKHTNNNLPLSELAKANGYSTEVELREAFANGEKIITPTKQLISIDENGQKVSEYILGENNVTKVHFNENGELLIDTQSVTTIPKPQLDDNTPILDKDNYSLNGKVISLKPNQTVSHIAANTDFTSTDLLEYNNLTLEQAKNLPVGFEIELPKSVNTTVGEYGNIKIFENFNDGGLVIAPNEQGFKEKINYSETSDLLIKGDISNPSEISFTNDNGDFEVWKKDSTGSFYEATKQTDNFTIHYEKNGHSAKTVSKINGFSDSATLEDIAPYTDYTANELKSFNYFENAIDDIIETDILVPSTKMSLYEGEHGSVISLRDIFGNEQLMVTSEDGEVSTYDATEFTYENTSENSYKIDILSALGEERTIISNKTGEYFDTEYIENSVGEIEDISFIKDNNGDYKVENLDYTSSDGISIRDSLASSAYIYHDSDLKVDLPSDWKSFKTQSNENGFYAEAIKTPDGDLIFAIRGTDGLSDIPQDVMLGMLQDTGQKEILLSFVKDVLDETDYRNIHFTGHSLGGHLAQEGMNYVLTEYVNPEGRVIIPSTVSGMGFNAPGYGESSVPNANFISVNSVSDPVNIFGGERLTSHELYLDTGKLLDHSVGSLWDYVNKNPFIGEYTTKTYHKLSKEDKLLIEKDEDTFTIREIEKEYSKTIPSKLKTYYDDAQARISFSQYFKGEITIEKVLSKLESSPKTMLELKKELESMGNDDIADSIDSNGKWKEGTPSDTKQKAVLEKTEGQALSTQIGSSLGGSIGSIINSNNDFSNVEKILVNTLTKTIGQNVGESFFWDEKGADGGEAFDDIAADGYKALASSVASFAVSAYFAKNDNLSDLLGMDGTFLGDFVDFNVSYTATNVIAHMIQTQSFTMPEFSSASFSGAIGGYLGSLAANELMGWDTQEEAIGSSVGSAIATVALTKSIMAALAMTGPVGWIIGAFIAAFGGSVIGGLIGGLFGGGTPPPPEAQAHLEFDEETGTYSLAFSNSDNGGNEQGVINLGENLGKQLVNMFLIPGGQLVDANGMPEIFVSQLDDLVKVNGHKGSFKTGGDLIADALSEQIPFINVEGGDPYVLRAIHRTNEEFLEGDPDITVGRADLNELYDNISLAQDYSKYMNETMLVLDEDGRVIADQALLTQMNEEYQAIQELEDEDAKTAAMEAFTQKYTFTNHKAYVDNLLDEISSEDIEAYKEGRANLIQEFDDKIFAAETKLENINSDLESIEKQLVSAQKMYENPSNHRMKESILAQINELNGQKTLLLEEQAQTQVTIEELKVEKEEAIVAYDDEHFKEIDAIHWNEVFALAEELKLDDHHYSEDFNKLNAQIAQFNYDEHEKNGELLEIDYDEYLSDVASKMIEQYLVVVEKEEAIEKLKQEELESQKAAEEDNLSKADIIDNSEEIAEIQAEIDALKENTEEALSILEELGYDLEAGYEDYAKAYISGQSTEEGAEVIVPSFSEFLKREDVIQGGWSDEMKVEITPERFHELLDLVGIEDPLENFQMAEDAFSFSGKSIHDLQFELIDGNLIITTFDKDLSEDEAAQQSKSFMVEDWESWNKEYTHIDLPDGTKINLDALLNLIGVEEGAGKVDVSEAFNEILAEDESLSEYLSQFDSNRVYIDTALDDKIKVFFGDNLIVTKEGDDEIQTGAGDDTILLGSGKDSVDAGLGNDTVSYENSESAVHVNLEEGGTLGDAQGDTYSGIENVKGTDYNDYIIGNDSNNELKGNAGNDILAGGAGADTLDGGEGIDLADYSESDEAVIVNINDNYAQGGDATGDTYINIEGVQGSSNADIIVADDNSNIIFANDGDDRVSAGDGNDIVHGGEGDDYLKGEEGNDELHAGAGNDVLIGGEGNDTFYSDEGKNVIEGGEGTDISVYKGLSTDYEVMFVNDHTLYVRAKDGSIQDTLKNIEEIAFDDAVFAIDYENQVLIKKAEFEVTEEVEENNDAVNNENSGSNQAAAIATAAMIGTVAAAETIETSSDEADYFSDDSVVQNKIEEEEAAVLVEEIVNPVVPVLSYEDPIFDDVQNIIAFEEESVNTVTSTVFDEDSEEVVINEVSDDESNINLIDQIVQSTENIELQNQDVDTNVNAELEDNTVQEEVIEEELPELLVPLINLDTNEVLEDGILSGIRISNPNLDSSIEVLITGIPDGVLLSAGTLRGNGEWYLQQKDLEGLELIPSLHDSNDFDIRIKATVTDIHGRVIQNVMNETIVIHAVADTANFEVENETAALEDILVPLSISTSLVDTVGGEDGEERIILSVENVPSDAILTAGRKDEESGIWYLLPEELEDLHLRPGLHNGDDFTIKVTSYTIESENDNIASISEEINVEITAVADTPILEVQDAQGDEDTQIALSITSDFIDSDDSEILSVRIENMPEGAILNKGEKDKNGIWHLTRAELGNLILTPTLHDAQDFTLNIIAQTQEKENGNIATINKNLNVSVNAVADNVELDLTQELSGEEKIIGAEDASIVFFDIKSTFHDQDGSESIHYIVEGLPEGTILSDGEALENGNWKVLPSQLEDLGIILKENSDKDFRLKVSAVTTEEENGHQEVTVKYIDCEVESVADFANLSVSHAQGLQNDFIDLDIASSLIDIDGSESLKIIIEQVPEKAILSNGIKDENGHWNLTLEDLENLKIRPEFNSIEDMELVVKAITTESKNADTQESVALLKVQVDEIPRDANLIVNAVEQFEDELCYLDIQIDESSLNPYDSISLELEIPEGLSLNNGEEISSTKWKLNPDDLENLQLNVPTNYAGSFYINIMSTVIKPDGTVTRSENPTKLPVDIIPVADEVSLSVSDININEDRLIYLNLDAKLSDLDGSEKLHIELKGIPTGTLLNVGQLQGDVWIIEQKDIPLVALLPEEDFSGDFEIEVKAVSTDSNNDTFELIKTMQVTVNEVLDAPILNVVDSYILNNEATLSIQSQLRDLDSSEILEIKISQLPENATLNNGFLNEDGSYTLSINDLSDLKILNLSDNTFELKIESISNSNQVVEKVINVAPVMEYNPFLLDIQSTEYSQLQESLNNVNADADIKLKVSGIPNGATLNNGILNNDGTYTIDKNELSSLKVIGADNQNLDLSFEIQSTLIHTFEPIVKQMNMTINSDNYILSEDNTFSTKFQEIQDLVENKETLYELEGLPEDANLIPSGTLNNGVYSFTKDELEVLSIDGVSESISLNLKAVISPIEEVETITEDFSVSILETREMPFMNVNNLNIFSSTQETDLEDLSDAVDNVQTGGGNDEIYSKSGADTIYSDESNGNITVQLHLSSSSTDIRDDEKIIYEIKSLPEGTTTNTGYLNNGILIIESENFNGDLELIYPYQSDELNLNIQTHVVNENYLTEYLSTSSIVLNVSPDDVAGSDYIDAGSMDDTIYSGDEDDIVLGQEGDDLIFAGNGNDYIDGGEGADRIDAGEGDDSIVMDAEDFDNNRFITEIIDAGEGFDTVTIQDDEGVTFDMGLTNVEKFVGGRGNDNVIGSEFADIVVGGDGADTYTTGAGDDIAYIDAEDIKAQSGSFVDLGMGYDKLYIDEHENVNFDVSNTNAEEIISGSGDDILKNNTTDTVKIYGMDGNDRIFASNSEDILDGGEGVDTIDYSNSNVGVNVNLNTGEVSGGFAQGDTISNFENIIGTDQDDNLTGNNEDNVFDAKGGNNTIDGFSGNNSVVFSGSLKDYIENNNIITAFNSTATVFTNSGINELTNINSLEFDDYKVYIDGTVNAPFVYDDEFSTVEDTLISINSDTLLDNDFSLEGSNLRVVGVKNSENGVAVLNDDGTITFTPHTNYNSSMNNTFDKSSALYKGRAGFEYIVEDENGNQSTAFSNIVVSPVNDAPTISSHSFYRNGSYTGHGEIIINDVDSDVSSMDVSVISSLTYTTTGRTYYRFHGGGDDGSLWIESITPTFTRTGYVNVNGRTPNDDGIFEYDYRGSYMGGHHYNTGRVDIYDMRPFVLQISDQGDIGTGDNVKSTTIHTGQYLHWLRSDPVVVDLDGDGIEIEEKFYEQHNETLLGVSSDDAILVWDFDQDGTISSDLETNWVALSQTANNDLEVLREIFDTNKDGLFNKEDEEWKNFALWQDKNSDGLVSDDEFVKISDSQIQEFNLEKNEEKEETYPVLEYASYTNKDGEEYEIGAAYLDITSTPEKLSEEDELIIKQAAKLNEQLASINSLDDSYEEVMLVDDLDNNENLEENIA